MVDFYAGFSMTMPKLPLNCLILHSHLVAFWRLNLFPMAGHFLITLRETTLLGLVRYGWIGLWFARTNWATSNQQRTCLREKLARIVTPGTISWRSLSGEKRPKTYIIVSCSSKSPKALDVLASLTSIWPAVVFACLKVDGSMKHSLQRITCGVIASWDDFSLWKTSRACESER